MVDIVQILKERLLETDMAKPEEIGGWDDGQFWLFEVGRAGETVPPIIHFASDEYGSAAVYQ